MTIITLNNMVDNIRIRLSKFRILIPDNFYCTTVPEIKTPYVDTLTDYSCYSTIATYNKYVGYRLKSQLRTALGYKPHKILIQDIPFTARRFCLLIDLSLPQMIYGHSAFEIKQSQLKEVIDAIYTELLRLGVEIDKEELLNTPRISRIDYCKNIIIQRPVAELVRILQKLQKPRSKKYYRYTSSISYGTKKKRLNIYDKINERIAKASNDSTSVTFKLARLLEVLEGSYGIHIFRIEQRLYGRQTFERELKGIIDPQDITLKSLFNEDIASHVLNKHWLQLAQEEKFKAILLGEQDLHTVITTLTRISKQYRRKTINSFYALYAKLLNDKGEEIANADMHKLRNTTSIKTYKKELYQLMHYLQIYDARFIDHQTITTSIKKWRNFELPILSCTKN